MQAQWPQSVDVPQRKRAARGLRALYADPLPLAPLSRWLMPTFGQSDRSRFRRGRIAADFLGQDTINLLDNNPRGAIVSDLEDIRRLWFCGSFGKGLLSRSIPDYILRCEATACTRNDFMQENKENRADLRTNDRMILDAGDLSVLPVIAEPVPPVQRNTLEKLHPAEPVYLSPYECLFLTHGLGILRPERFGHADAKPLSHRASPPSSAFVRNFIAYHYYRSKGWCTRDGLKYGCDFILYRLCPVFGHGEHGVVVLPGHIDERTTKPLSSKVLADEAEDDHTEGEHALTWLDVLAVNRVLSQASKRLVLCFVHTPSANPVTKMRVARRNEIMSIMERSHIATIGVSLSEYDNTVRSAQTSEVLVRRWVPHRMK